MPFYYTSKDDTKFSILYRKPYSGNEQLTTVTDVFDKPEVGEVAIIEGLERNSVFPLNHFVDTIILLFNGVVLPSKTTTLQSHTQQEGGKITLRLRNPEVGGNSRPTVSVTLVSPKSSFPQNFVEDLAATYSKPMTTNEPTTNCRNVPA